ncbi:bifunctional Cleft lip and palate transmembrane 1/Cleft lip and palate transmembrane protein 1-like protein [Babesia duncani]|uniref:Bifunctional Cleft lip and palate transmembrane 1/Cleft lip and palate transmembrane protein 1-like protein n=1 Tax=Babesia duncani TaxID=323732 RepID=A0AAD9PMX6_9APIC|nr:bifunctional Cleft lip and palate transmembrane 1/Cleft lip and palate transmembrane protein 1-like protein [Babesia duncani]
MTADTPSTSSENDSQGRNWFTQLIVQLIVFQVIFYFLKGNSSPSPKREKFSLSYRNHLQPNELFDIFVYVTKDDKNVLKNLHADGDLVFYRENQLYTHQFNKPYDVEKIRYRLPQNILKDENAHLFVSVFLIPHKAYQERKDPFYTSTFKTGFQGHIVHKIVPLTMIRKTKKSKAVNLLKDQEEEDGDYGHECKHWIPRLDVNVVYDTVEYTANPADTLFGQCTVHANGVYDPIVYLSQFWILEEHYVPMDPKIPIAGAESNAIDVEDPIVELTLNYSTCSPTFFALSHQMKLNSETGGVLGTQTSKEIEMIKKMLMTTHIYMLIFSGCFILLHTIFSFYALKNDIQFWHQNNSMEGLSALSIVINFVCDIIVTLYILDNENTSWLVIFEICIGVLASGWKVSKAIKITLTSQFPYVSFSSAKNYVESSTKKYDEIAIKYMSIALAPCVVGYAIYSLYYEKHKSWYSYIVSVAAGSVYTFGFIMMTPQVYINYKLKSVDHLPWRALFYKTLNTFVDDVASFLIEMPWLHRLSCFRDDIIFFCYLYQRWAYRKNVQRPNYWTASLSPEEKNELLEKNKRIGQQSRDEHEELQENQELQGDLVRRQVNN